MRPFAAVSLTLLLGLAGCLAPASPVETAQDAAPFAPASDDALIPVPSGSVSGGAEPSILVTRAGTVYIGDTSGLSRSRDDGATWQRVSIPFLSGLLGDGWALAEDDAGTIYVAVTNGHAISMAASNDDGATWRLSHAIDASPVADRPWLAARGDGEVAIVYYDSKLLRESCLHSIDGGQTFLTRYVGIQASPNAGNVVFGPDGALYYSTGGVGYKWAVPCVGEPQRLLHGGSGGAQIFTQIVVDENGDVYIARPSTGNGAMELRATHGMQGITRRTITVSPPDSLSNTFGTLSVQDGEVAVAWYGSETAGDPRTATSARWNVHLSRVTDIWGTPSIDHQVLTSTPNHEGGFCMDGVACTSGDRDLLDYFMVDHAPDGSVHVAYGHDGAGSRAEVRHVRVAG